MGAADRPRRVYYEWSFGEDRSCQTSTHPKGRHEGNRVARRKSDPETVKGFRGQPTVVWHYIDHVVCVHCGAEHDQEWLPA